MDSAVGELLVVEASTLAKFELTILARSYS